MSDNNNFSPTQFPIENLQPNPLQPRSKMDNQELQELADSIKIHGVLEPLVVAHTPAGYQILAGERRWKAAKMAGLTQVPIVVKETSPKGMLEMALIENVQRVDLDPIERGKAILRLKTDFNLTSEEIAVRIGKSPAYVSNALRMLDLPDAIKDGLLSGQISEGHARALAGIPDMRDMVEVYKQVLRENASVRRTETLSRNMKRSSGVLPQQTNAARFSISPTILRMQEKLIEVLGGNTKVEIARTRATTKVTFILVGNEEQTELRLRQIMKLTHPPRVMHYATDTSRPE